MQIRIAPWFRVALAASGLLAGAAHAGELSLGGKLFADFSQLQQTDRVAHTRSQDSNGDLKRLYLDADYVVDDAWSVHLTTDVNWLRDQPLTDVWVKHFYLQRKFAGGTVLRLGVDDMPMLSLTSQWYGYRYIDPVGASMAKLDTAADWGVHLQSRLASNVDMAVAVVTGAGYKRPALGHRADVEAVLAWHPVRQAVIAVGGYSGELAADDTAAHPLRHEARRVDLLAAWAGERWRFGMRYVWASNWTNLYGLRNDRERNGSAWASLQLAPQWSVFARLDRSHPKYLLDPSQHSRYANLGVEWRPRKSLRLALVGKRSDVRRHDNELRHSNEVGVWSEWSF